MAALVRNEKTFNRIVSRQFEIKWGVDYDPSIRATPMEAPGVSTASRLKSYEMNRQIHLLSRNEVKAAMIVLYNPAVWFVREQQMLYWDDHEHFLHGHPRSGAEHWPHMRGTWHVAGDLGVQKSHPVIRMYSEKRGRRVRMPFPYIGDLLIFLQDDVGPYAVNITVKDKLEDFQRPFNLLGAKTPAEQAASAINRHNIERLAYAAAGIRTEQVAGRLIPSLLFNNLRFLHNQNWRIRHFNLDQIAIGLEIAAEGPKHEHSPIRIGLSIERELGLQSGAGCVIVWHGLWTRRIRADLYDTILPDRPLRPERKDVLEEFSHWFVR